MKNLLFYIIFLLSTINLSAQTYQYHPFIDTTKVWVTLFSSGTAPKVAPDDYYGIYYFQGDTSMNGFTYTKLWRKNFLHFIASNLDTLTPNPIFKYFFREDTLNKKIYRSFGNSEELFLNYNSQIGDTISTGIGISKILEFSLDTILNNDIIKKIKIANLNTCTDTSYLFEKIPYPIEDPTHNYVCSIGGYYLSDIVFCIYNSTGMLYNSGLNLQLNSLNFGNGCDYYHAISSNSKPLNLTNIYQNSCFQDYIPFNLTFYNYFGLELKKIANITEFCMQDFEIGLYIVKIEQNEKTEFMKIYKN